jgi:radical SAM protein with 4Fe4S-binding SPASM domain
MELIVKPTEACNFKCTFCSSTNITDEKSLTLDLSYIFKFLARYPNTGTIIVNGGDPLMVDPKYYWEIIEFLDNHDLNTTLSLTTNLWAFFKKPQMWEELFKHPRVGVTTSFNYGDSRRVTKDIVYSEELFQAVSDKFLDRIGYRPDFISVITDENEDTAIDNVRLARKMDVECKLNYAMSSGIQCQPYQLSKMYKLYTEVYNLDLWQWEYNTKQMMHRLSGKSNSCPQNRTCDEGIRVLQPSGDYYSCGSYGDDRQFAIDFNAELSGQFFTPLQHNIDVVSLKDECFSCVMFSICNGCRKTIGDMKHANMVEQHCNLMKLISPEIIEINNNNATQHIDLLPKE